MKEIKVIILFALFVNNNRVTEGHSVKDYLRGFLALKQVPNLRHGILPGTLWCGRGSIAREESELGMYAEMDKCCRAHDHCEDYIRPKTTKYGLYNKYSICRSSLCECEEQFYDCLAQTRGFYAYAVKGIYFRKCKQCFRTFYDPQECENEGLDIIEETDRKGRRVFCARFDRNPKRGHRHGITTPASISATKVPTWDMMMNPYDSRFHSGEDVENDSTYESNTSIEDND